MILALFTGTIAGAVTVPETAYGHIAIQDKVVAEELAEELPHVPTQSLAKQGTDSTVASSPVKHSGTSTEAAVREYFSDIPVMAEIARCESTFRHYLNDGSVLRGRVDSADTGVMQINKRYHQGAANAMNLDLDIYTTTWHTPATCTTSRGCNHGVHQHRVGIDKLHQFNKNRP